MRPYVRIEYDFDQLAAMGDWLFTIEGDSRVVHKVVHTFMPEAFQKAFNLGLDDTGICAYVQLSTNMHVQKLIDQGVLSIVSLYESGEYYFPDTSEYYNFTNKDHSLITDDGYARILAATLLRLDPSACVVH
jgi:hypothetical protein